VCMDYTMIDLTGVSKLKTNWIGQEVVILGRQGSKFITAESLAKSSGTNTYQVFTNFSNRVPRVYL
ncbi:MAG: alanine racemase C-terminal domain-containing protein, partial [Bdellovibrionales bacterium]